MPIDKMTGLEIKEITPYPRFDPETAEQIGPESATLTPVGQRSQGLESSSLLDKLLFTILGTPDSKLDAATHRKKHAQRQNASAAATSAASDPGGRHMGIPVAGGKSLGESLDGPLQAIASLFRSR